MNLDLFDSSSVYTSGSQNARAMTERWAATWMFCPNCGNPNLSQFPANRPVADFFCEKCSAQYELKSQKKAFGRKIVDGAYESKIRRLESDDSPNLIIMQYDIKTFRVVNITSVPSRFFSESIIEKRKPLKATARRAGWIGSNIILEKIPSSGKIPIVINGAVVSRESIRADWERTRFLEQARPSTRGWLTHVMRIIDGFQHREFTIDNVYNFEDELQGIYPKNKNVKPKIRQQLQFLRDRGYINFTGRGRYQKR